MYIVELSGVESFSLFFRSPQQAQHFISFFAFHGPPLPDPPTHVQVGRGRT